jgi:DNA-binding MarR family transcriptional regulator
MTDPATEAWRAITALVFDNDRRDAVATALGMSYLRVKLLRSLSAGPSTLRELAGRVAADPPYVTIMVDDLAKRDLVERVPHPTDRRAKLVRLTDAGSKAVEQAERLLDEPPPALKELAPEDLRRLVEILG